MVMLNDSFVTNYKTERTLFYHLRNQLECRITEILDCIGSVLGIQCERWWFYGAPEGSHGNVALSDLSNRDGWLEFEVVDWNDFFPTEIREYRLAFPVKFLFMTNEKIQEKIKNLMQIRQTEDKNIPL